MSIEGLDADTVNNFAHGYLILVPLEYQGAVCLENAPAFMKAVVYERLPILRQLAILLCHPSVVSGTAKVRRIKDDVPERLVRKWQMAKVRNEIRIYGAVAHGLAVATLPYCLRVEASIVYK